MITVQIPDVEVDLQSDKNTWVSKLGRPFGFTAAGILLVAASLYFFLFPWLGFGTAPVNTQAIGWISLFPAAVGILGWLQRPSDRKRASKLAAAIILSLTVFSLAVDGYLLYLVLLSRASGG